MTSLIEKGLTEVLSRTRRLALGPDVEREASACIDRSVSKVVNAHLDDAPHARHLHTLLVELVQNDGLDSFYRTQDLSSADIGSLSESFTDLGRDPSTLGIDFNNLVRELAFEISREITESAEQPGSPLFNYVATRKLKSVQTDTAWTREAISSLSDVSQETLGEVRTLSSDFTRTNRTPTAKALLDGPIRALRLQSKLLNAEQMSDPDDSAKALGKIADDLAANGYFFHSRMIEHKQAEVLANGNQISKALSIWMNLALVELQTGRLWISSDVKQCLDNYRESASDTEKAKVDATLALENWYEHSRETIQKVQNVLTLLNKESDPDALRFAVLLCEFLSIEFEGWNAGQYQKLKDVEHLALDWEDPFVVRFHILMAEAREDWNELLALVSRDSFTAADTGLILCRYGRWLTLQGRGEEAINAYQDSIEPLAEAGLFGECSGALQSIVFNEFKLVGPSDSVIETFELAKVGSGGESRFRYSGNPRIVCIGELYESSSNGQPKLADALRAAQGYLWESRVSGNVSAEMEARKFLGDTYRLAGESSAAILNFVLAGEATKAEDLALSSPVTDVSFYVHKSAPWIVSAALSVITAQGDYLPESDISRLIPILIERTEGMNQTGFGAQVQAKAWSALAEVIFEVPEDQLAEILDRIEPLIIRELNRYTFMDNSLLTILIRLHSHRPDVRSRASEIIAQCLPHLDLARKLENFLLGTIADDDFLRESVIAEANAGNLLCRNVLLLSGIEGPPLEIEAQQLYQEVIDFAVGVEQDTVTVSDRFERAAEFSSVLTPQQQKQLQEHLLSIAQDEMTHSAYRGQAIDAIEVLAPYMNTSEREKAFRVMTSLVYAEESRLPLDTFALGSMHPLSRFRIDLRNQNFNWKALEVAGALALTEEHANHLFEIIGSLGQYEEKGWIRATCNMIYALDPSLRNGLPLEDFAYHPENMLRQLGVSLWVERPYSSPTLGAVFAKDGYRIVRQVLAGKLGQLSENAHEIAEEIQTILLDDPSSLIRARVKLFLSGGEGT